MASSENSTSPLRHHDPVTSLRDCPHCGSLCLGPSVLPCGHLLCRRCVHDVLQLQGSGCPQCGQSLYLPRKHWHQDNVLTPSQMLQQMGTDPVVEYLVLQELERDGDIRCLNCANTKAANVCLDCQEYYCEFCSANHRRSRLGKRHVLRLLPLALMNSSSVLRATPRPRSSPVRRSSSSSSADVIRNITDSGDVSRDESGGVEGWVEWVRKEMIVFQQASMKHQEVETVVQDILSLGQQFIHRLHAHRKTLNTYHHLLSRLDVIQRIDHAAYVTNVHKYDVSVDVRTEPLGRRLSDVRKCRQCPDVNALKRIRTQLDQMFHSAEQEHTPVTTPTPPVRTPPTPSSTPTPTPDYHPPPPPPPSHPATTPTPACEVDWMTSGVDWMSSGVDWMTTSPIRVFTCCPTSAGERKKPRIRAVISLPDNALVLTDFSNDNVKVMSMTPPHPLTASLPVPERPWGLARLTDGLVAMTTSAPVIYLMKVTGDAVFVVSRMQTGRQYRGIAGDGERYLVASCGTSSSGPAAVDLLTRQGDLVRTVTDSLRVPGLKSPNYLCNSGDGHVLLSDCGSHTLYKVNVTSGHVTHTLQNTLMMYPRQVCVDRGGSVLVASGDGHCVLVRGKEEGSWRRLLVPSFHCDSWYDYPSGICLTPSGHLVVTWARGLSDSMVIGYELE